MQHRGAGAAAGDGGLDREERGHLGLVRGFQCIPPQCISQVGSECPNYLHTFIKPTTFRQDWPSDARVAMMRLLAYGAKEDDIVLILHMDRKDHSVMNYAQQFDRLPLKEMENLALLVIALSPKCRNELTSHYLESR